MDRVFDHKSHMKNYVMWENKYNMSWLNASMALVAHNKVMKKYSGASPHSGINKIISEYESAFTILNSSEENKDEQINVARGILNNCRENILQYLQAKHVLTEDHESAFRCLYNLLVEDPVMRQVITSQLVIKCTNCGLYTETTERVPIITLSKIDSFDPENLTHVCICNCSKSEVKINLMYVCLPPCLIFHFENGAGNEPPPLIFKKGFREYHLTGIMTLVKYEGSPVNDFIAWVRDQLFNKWLKCDDLNFDASFSLDYPDIKFQDVCMYVYESCDDLGEIVDGKLLNASKLKLDSFVNLLKESDTYNNNPQITAKTVNKKSTLDDVQQKNLNNLLSDQDCQACAVSEAENYPYILEDSDRENRNPPDTYNNNPQSIAKTVNKKSTLDDQQKNLNNLLSDQDCQAGAVSEAENYPYILEDSGRENRNPQSTAKTVHKKSTLDDVQQENLNNLPSDQGCQAGAASEAENSKSNSDKDVTILEHMLGDDLSCGPDCNCETCDLEEIVDTGVDFVFAYFCKLSEEYAKRSNK